MDVSVEEPVHEGALEPSPYRGAEQGRQVVAVGAEGGDVVDGSALDEAHHEHSFGDEAIDRFGQRHRLVMARTSQVPSERRHRCRLVAEVELAAQGGREVVDDGDGVRHLADGAGMLEYRGQHAEEPQVALDGATEVRAPHLHGHSATVVENGGVDLGDRAAASGSSSKRAKSTSTGAPSSLSTVLRT